MTMTVYDCCPFWNENDLYELRLNQHWDFVDKFIVTEVGETHTGNKKPFNFDHDRFEKYKSKIIYNKFESFEEEINNNTYLLESEFDWTGISFELDEELNESFRSVRKNPVISGDATLHDYTKLIEENNLPTHIDYLQIDIDPYWQSFKCLKAIDFDKFEFSFVAFDS